MKHRLTGVARAALLQLACLAILSPSAAAQPVVAAAAVVPGERVSDWLLRNAGPDADVTALHWQVQAERLSQGRLRDSVLTRLRDDPAIQLSAQARAHLDDWLRRLPLTGRLTLAIGDARWLQSAPAQDPVLGPGHSVLLLARPRAVTVLTEAGRPCQAAHRPSGLARDYLRACLGDDAATQIDWVWVAQPDGRTARYGIAPWSLESQDEPGPGAWIWAPDRAAGIPAGMSDNLARFLATQLPGESLLEQGQQPIAVSPRRADEEAPRSAQLTASDWGEIGVLQTPSARMAPTGSIRLQLNQVQPYTRGTVMIQPLDWFEAGFRYSDIANRLSFAAIGNQSRKDKSIDFKLRLREESAFWPQVALGVRDLGGTGLFSGEYLVASKRWGNWDASAGLGWGYLGARGNIKNPLSVFGNKFNTRPGNNTVTGGTANLSSMFRGPTALFGGLQWHSPYAPLTLKFELDGNDYQREPLGNNLRGNSRFNVGAVYRYSPNVDFSLGFERGNRLAVGLTVHGGLDTLDSPKLLDPQLALVRPEAPAQLPDTGWGGTAESIERFTGWSVREITHQHVTTTVRAETDGAIHLQDRVERALKLLHRDAPASTTRFVLQLQDRGLPMSQIVVDRTEWVARNTRAEPPALRLPAQQTLPSEAYLLAAPHEGAATDDHWQGMAPGLRVNWGPSYSQILGGPDSFLLYQIGLQAFVEQRFSDNTWLTGSFNVRVLDNYDKFTFVAPSNLPRVRTFQREYVTSSRLTMPVFQLTHVSALGGGHYLSAYGGMLESMYGGIGAEWLYRPWQGRMAWGIDLNHVRQRDFRQNFAFRNYTVNTGHATMYWDTGWNDVQVNLSVGRYLAADLGATLEVKRTFPNGVAVGAWATKTNISAAQFGEGSFDKGIYVTVPFDVMLPKSSPGAGSIVWNPLTRDGGARLGRQFPLYELTRQRDRRALSWGPARLSARASAEGTSYVVSEPEAGLFESTGSSASDLSRQIADVPSSTWLWAGGAVLASSLLDKRVDRWSIDHQGGTSKRLGDAANLMPYALAAGVGLLYTGIAGDAASDTAQTAIKAATISLGASWATRFATGRARPYQGLGNSNFDGPGSGSFKSGFPSAHTAVAFALATPFAQQYDMPWLYGVAAASAFGRVQKREHWLSDTVAGAFVGYAIGSMLSDQQMGRSGVRLDVTPNSVVANWAFY
jgi:membrane-associated phospholipid phosphatase